MHEYGDLIRIQDRQQAAEDPHPDSGPIFEAVQRLSSDFGPNKPRATFFPGSVLSHSRLVRQFFEITKSGNPDAILLTDLDRFESFDNHRAEYSLVPVINISGSPTHLADADLVPDDPQSWRDAAAIIRRFRTRREMLPATFRTAATPAIRMLAYLFVSGKDLTPVRVPQSRYFFAYQGFQNTRATITLAEALADAGMLRRSFVDRHSACPNCQSHRLVVREECPACRSANLSQAAFLHHFSCAHIGPESDFRQGSALICPKCLKQLRHYGKDYDRPGDALVCRKCAGTTTEPAVGFQCQDCDAHIDGDLIKTVDIHAYSLTDHFLSRLSGKSSAGVRPASGSINRLPPKLREQIGRFVGKTGSSRRGFVAKLDYASRHDIARTKGDDAFQALRQMFKDRLQGLLADTAHVHSSTDGDYVYFHSLTPEEFKDSSEQILAECDSVLSVPLRPKFEITWVGSGEETGG
ncbi:hypothetical protein [Oricola thermophila]|uniref:Thaumarchaeal output domain-containing protein n=1 Tax=Oricola thermophila TaxID=2742145 RepID=A0A6N1VFD4_9HYPH|nr:hypothetical protein [Oricola thermophila]QKV19283.1 hypothetical protein HTY61_12860 [Oricola thermophila]